MENTSIDQNTTTSSPSESSLAPIHTPSKSPQIFTSLALILFGTLIGVLASRFLPTPGTTNAPTPVPTIDISPTPPPTISETANWKTYISTAFSFKYDPNLYFDQLTAKDTEVDLYNKDPRLSNQKNVYYLGFVSTQNTTFNKQINLIKQGNQNITYTSNKLNDYTIYEVKGNLSPGGVNDIDYFIEGNNVLTEVHIGNITDVKEPEYLGFFNTSIKILSTFKFTDSTSSQQVLGIQPAQCCSCPTMIDASQIGKDGWVTYEKGKDYTAERPKVCSSPNIGACASCPPL